MTPGEFARWLAYFRVKADLEREALELARREGGGSAG